MCALFEKYDPFAALLLVENTDPDGKHLEYKDTEGKLFARVAKVYKEGGFLNLFPAVQHLRFSRNW